MQFKAILFDAGDILYFRPKLRVFLREFLKRLGLACPNPDPDFSDLKERSHAGEISEAEYFKRVLDLYGVEDPEISAAGCRELSARQAEVTFFDGVPETLHALKSAGMRLGIVTNTHASTDAKLDWFRKVGIDAVWDAFATSCELGVNKPDSRIYLAALEPIGVLPQEAAFVGHSIRDLGGAKTLGMTTIAFNRDDETVEADIVIEQFADLLDVAKSQKSLIH